MAFSMAATRRIFLLGSLQALGVLALANCSRASPLITFTPEEHKAFAAIADAFLPHGGAFDIGAADVDVAGRADRIFATWDTDVLTGLRGAIAFVEQQAPAMVGAAAPFSALDAETRGRVLGAMLAAKGVPAQIYSAMKFTTCTFFATADAAWPAFGYPGPMLLEGN